MQCMYMRKLQNLTEMRERKISWLYYNELFHKFNIKFYRSIVFQKIFGYL